MESIIDSSHVITIDVITFGLQLSGRNVRQSPIVEVDFVRFWWKVPLLNLGVAEQQEYRGSKRRHPGRHKIGRLPPFKRWLQWHKKVISSIVQ